MKLCAKTGSIAIYTLRNITNKLLSPVKAFDPGLKLFELRWELFMKADNGIIGG